MDTITNEVPSGTETAKLKAELRQLRADISELAGTLRGLMANKARLGRDKAQQAMDQAGEKIGEHPFASLLIALGAGFLVGFLLERNRRT